MRSIVFKFHEIERLTSFEIFEGMLHTAVNSVSYFCVEFLFDLCYTPYPEPNIFSGRRLIFLGASTPVFSVTNRFGSRVGQRADEGANRGFVVPSNVSRK